MPSLPTSIGRSCTTRRPSHRSLPKSRCVSCLCHAVAFVTCRQLTNDIHQVGEAISPEEGQQVFVDWKQNKPQKPAKHPADDSTPSVSVDEEQEDMMVPGPDMFQGFSFVSSRAPTNDSSAGALPSSPSATATATTTTTSSATPASTFFYSSSKLASVYTRFTICIKQAAALPTTATGHKVWVTWKCGKKKESSGQTDRVVCVDREASWSDPTGKSSGFVFELELSLAFDEEAQEFSNKTLELTLHSETGKIGKFKGLSVCYGLMATTTWHTVRQTERQRERERERSTSTVSIDTLHTINVCSRVGTLCKAF
jgi:hypothetical protein